MLNWLFLLLGTLLVPLKRRSLPPLGTPLLMWAVAAIVTGACACATTGQAPDRAAIDSAIRERTSSGIWVERRVGYQTLINEVLARHVRRDVA